MVKSNARETFMKSINTIGQDLSLFLYFLFSGVIFLFLVFLLVSQEANLQCNSKAGRQVVFIKPKGFRFPIKGCVQV